MKESLIASAVFLTGLVVGSFLNCLIYRLEKNEGFLKGRSYCPHCKHILSWRDLIPILSFLALRGKCRYCQKRISVQYPLVELTTGFLFFSVIGIFLARPGLGEGGNFLTIPYYLFIVSSLIIIFVYDLKHYIIPDKIIYPAIIAALIFNFQLPRPFDGSAFNNSILSALGASLFFLAIILFSRGNWMGLGDFKLAIFMGMFLGFPGILVALFLAFFAGAIIGLGLITAGKKGFKSEIPFGPFLVAGTFAAMFWGQEIVKWYINLIT